MYTRELQQPHFTQNQEQQYQQRQQYQQQQYSQQQYSPQQQRYPSRQQYGSANEVAPGKCLFCGEEGHFKSTCQSLNEMTNKGIVHMKEDRRAYMGRSRDVPVNRLGFATIREAALAAQPQPAATSSAILVNSIETVFFFFFFFFFFIVTSPRIGHPAWRAPPTGRRLCTMRSHRRRPICPTHAKRKTKKEKHYIWACMPAPPPPPTHCHLRTHCHIPGGAFQHSSLPAGRNLLVFPSHSVGGISLAHSAPGMGAS